MYPDRVPVVLETKPPLEAPSKNRMLMLRDQTFAQVIVLVRARLSTLQPYQAVFFMTNKVLPANSQMLGELYDQHKSQDGILYITARVENAFGYM